MSKRLFVVIPCFNEEEVLPETARRLKIKMDELAVCGLISADSRVLFVDDGSSDATWEVISSLRASDKLFTGVKLSRNCGEQNAFWAGMLTAREYSDIMISMDADLQDDIEVMGKMIEENNNGNDIVFGVRASRRSDSFLKRLTAQSYYKLVRLLGVDLVYNHADYRLMSRRALDALASFEERNLFLRGMVASLGFKTSNVEYERGKRFAGESKYPVKKMLELAVNGVTAFSSKPIAFVGLLGLLSALAALGGLIALCVLGAEAPHWLLIFSLIWLMSAVELFALRTVGEYIGKTYTESKKRPRYIIAENLLDKQG